VASRIESRLVNFDLKCGLTLSFARLRSSPRAATRAEFRVDVVLAICVFVWFGLCVVCVCDYREGLYMRLGLRVKNYFNAAKMSAMDDSSIFVFLIHLRTCFLVLS